MCNPRAGRQNHQFSTHTHPPAVLFIVQTEDLLRSARDANDGLAQELDQTQRAASEAATEAAEAAENAAAASEKAAVSDARESAWGGWVGG